ncbi:MAG: FAD binding domain-containing protein [Phycisphaeraceae bacterium]|nr:FAD binding domain-containing protein [Phycisphaeraceae bacterium]
MNRFAYAQPATYTEAAALAKSTKYSLPVLKAGGMDIVDHLKEGLIEPDLVIDIKRLRQDGAKGPVSEAPGEGGATVIRIEAGSTLSDLAASALLRDKAPGLCQAIEWAATPQVRNTATAAGNLLQRPRCWYYRNAQFDCLKKGGSTCFAKEGENKFHAIFGDGPCYIVHPSNLALALSATNGTVHLVGSERSSLPVKDLYHLPERGIRSEHNLNPGEVVTHLTLSPAPASGFYAVKEKQSFDWPLVMAFVTLDLSGETITSARVWAGAVAPIPWELPAVARAFAGLKVTDDAGLRKAASLCVQGANPLSDNAYKLRLLPVAVHRAALRAAGRLTEVHS